MSGGFGAIGPFGPDDIRQMMESLGQAREEQQAKTEIVDDANRLRMRRFLEGLSDDQLDDMEWFMVQVAADGKHNYMTQMLLGIVVAMRWARAPISVPEEPPEL